MRKIKFIYLMIFLSTLCFAFKIDELEFNKIVDQNKKVEKIFNLTNNGLESKLYKITIEGDNNIKVTPSLLNLLPQESQEFKVEVTGNSFKGNHNYFLVIKEVKKKQFNKGITLNKTIKIKQKYTIK